MNNTIADQKYLRRLLGNYKKNMAHVPLNKNNFILDTGKEQIKSNHARSKRVVSESFFSEWHTMSE